MIFKLVFLRFKNVRCERMPLETLLSPSFGVAGSLSFSNTLRVASHKTMLNWLHGGDEQK